MLSHIFFALCAATAITASPIGELEVRMPAMHHDEVMVLHKNGTNQVMKHADWMSKVEAAGYLNKAPAVNETFLKFTSIHDNHNYTEGALDERGISCDNQVSVVTDTTQRFVDWDVQMSQVVCANGAMTINVLQGYSVANAVTVSGNINPTLIADKLEADFGVQFSRTWTTTTSITTGGTVEDGKCGVMITQPLTTRRYGRTFRGCPGALTQVGTWMADDHGHGSYAGVDWVSGAISMCKKTQRYPPLSRCLGGGDFR